MTKKTYAVRGSLLIAALVMLSLALYHEGLISALAQITAFVIAGYFAWKVNHNSDN